jgi:hypothetical protein
MSRANINHMEMTKRLYEEKINYKLAKNGESFKF